MTTRKTLIGVLSLALTVLALAAPVRAAEAELAEKTGGYGGGFEQATMYRWPDRFHLRTCFGISDPAAAQDLTLALAYLLLCGVGLRANDRFGPSPWCSSNDRLACGVFLRARHAHPYGTQAGRSS